MPKPVALRRVILPSSSDPSKYQVASSNSGLLKSGRINQLMNPSCLAGGTGILRTMMPLVSSSLLRLSHSLPNAKLALAGGTGQPAAGLIALHRSRCSRVPASSKHSRQRLHVMPKASTRAFLAWVHCPPFKEEARDAAHIVSQHWFLQSLLGILPFSKGLSVAAKSSTTGMSPTLCGIDNGCRGVAAKYPRPA
eukprot:2072273-Karenia_brevis.AAC.1